MNKTGYLPAYCEDSDLAFRIRAVGLKVLYQPAARVVHYEGITHGTDTRQGVKAQQVTNTEKLRQRWHEVLLQEHLPAASRVSRARDRSLRRQVVLVVDHCIPEPDRDAGSRTMIAFIDALLTAGNVVKFWPANGLPTPGYLEALQQRGVEVPVSPWDTDLSAWLSANGAEIDAVLLSRPTTAQQCLQVLRKQCRAPVIFYGHDLHHARMRQEAQASNSAIQHRGAEQMEALEREVWAAVDLVLYPSEEEARTVRGMAPGTPVRAIQPYALADIAPRATVPPAKAGLIFVAGFSHSPNVDAATWFVREIMSRIHAVYPGLPVALVGSNPTEAVRELAGNGVTVTGFVSDEELVRRYAAARIAICPLRVGAGVKMKVVEALHQGMPLVTTSVGIQGLDGVDEALDIADTPEAFAAAVLRLLQDDTLCAARAAAGQAYVRAHFSPRAMQAALEAAFAAVRTDAEAA